MPFSDPILAGSTLIRPAIQSPDYEPGVSGWSINADGTSEFNGGMFRGAVLLDGGKRQLGVAVPAVLTAWTPDYAWQNLDLRYFTNGVDFFFEALVHNNNFGTDSYMRGIYTQASGVQIIDLIDASGTVPSIKEGSDFYNTRSLQHAYRHTDLLLTASATLNVEDPTLNNATPETWHPLALRNGWGNWGGGQVAAQGRLVPSPSNEVRIIGRIAGGATTSGTVIANLGAAYRPTSNVTIHINNHAGNTVVPANVAPSGDIAVLGSFGNDLSFNALIPRGI